MTRARGKVRVARVNRRLRRRAMLILFAVFLVSAAVFSLLGKSFYGYVLASPRFQVKSIVISGLLHLDPERVRAAAGITEQDNIWLFDAEAARLRVEALPYVRSCRIERAYPHKVFIDVEERLPVALLEVSNRAYAVDPEGIVLEEYMLLDTSSMPLITNVPDLGYIEPGQQIDRPEFYEALDVWRAYSLTGLESRWTLSELSALSPNEITMIVDEIPFRMIWGRSDFCDYTVQAQRLAHLWDQKGGSLTCNEFLDLRFDRDLVCK